MGSYDGFVVHHSAGPQPMDDIEGAERVRAIQRFHQDARGWVDVGYNFLIDGGGNLYQGRPTIDGDQARAAHSPGVNSTHVGICLMGCFHPPASGCDDAPTDEQIDALVRLCRHLVARYWMRSPELAGHRDLRATACPGDRVYDRLAEVRERVGGPYTLTLDRPDPPGA